MPRFRYYSVIIVYLRHNRGIHNIMLYCNQVAFVLKTTRDQTKNVVKYSSLVVAQLVLHAPTSLRRANNITIVTAIAAAESSGFVCAYGARKHTSTPTPTSTRTHIYITVPSHLTVAPLGRRDGDSGVEELRWYITV